MMPIYETTGERLDNPSGHGPAAEQIAELGIAESQLQTEEYVDQDLSNTRIDGAKPLISPDEVVGQYKHSPRSKETVLKSRAEIRNIVENPNGRNRLLVVVGPCSMHDVEAGQEYSEKLIQIQEDCPELLIVERVFTEKPRTTIGWEGLIEDPRLDGSYDKDAGYLMTRKYLLDLAEKGLPAAMELVNMSSPQYLDDLIAWGAIGARTVESQPHRKLASGVSFPVGLKNGTGGSIAIAIEGIEAARHPHYMDGIDMNGQTQRYRTTGNRDTHIILRGGRDGPNYNADHIKRTKTALIAAELEPAIMIDCSHRNSANPLDPNQIDYTRQVEVAEDIGAQINRGENAIIGVMLESFLVGGKQPFVHGKTKKENLLYGQSITDACIDINQTSQVLTMLNDAVVGRQALAKKKKR